MIDELADLVSSCKSECSRERCRPLTEEHTLCAKVDKNEYCPKSNVGSGCNQMWLNYDRSYVTYVNLNLILVCDIN